MPLGVFWSWKLCPDGNTLPLDGNMHERDGITIISDGNMATPDGINGRKSRKIGKIPPMRKLDVSINGDFQSCKC